MLLGYCENNMSKVWKYFEKVESGSKVQCNICKIKLKFHKSTSTMHSHLKQKHSSNLTLVSEFG